MRDGIEVLIHIRNETLLNEDPCRQFIFDDDGWHEGHAIALSRQEAKHCHVIHFRKHDRLNAVPREFTVERNADIAIDAGEENGHAPQIFRVAKLLLLETSPADETNRLLPQQSADQARARVELPVRICQHHIDGEGLKLAEKVPHRARANDQFHIGAADKRTKG